MRRPKAMLDEVTRLARKGVDYTAIAQRMHDDGWDSIDEATVLDCLNQIEKAAEKIVRWHVQRAGTGGSWKKADEAEELILLMMWTKRDKKREWVDPYEEKQY